MAPRPNEEDDRTRCENDAMRLNSRVTPMWKQQLDTIEYLGEISVEERCNTIEYNVRKRFIGADRSCFMFVVNTMGFESWGLRCERGMIGCCRLR